MVSCPFLRVCGLLSFKGSNKNLAESLPSCCPGHPHFCLFVLNRSTPPVDAVSYVTTLFPDTEECL